MDKNKEDFDKCASDVFELLYQEFPKETDVVVDDLVGITDDEMIDNYFATIRFLQREGLIRYQKFDYGSFNGGVLTAKGLRILDTVMEKGETIAQQISKALGNENKAEIRRVIKEVIKLCVRTENENGGGRYWI